MTNSFIIAIQKQHPIDTITTMEAAAEHRYWDGLHLATAFNHGTAAVYLLGYVAEILIKTAYYRFREIDPALDVSKVRQLLKLLGATWPDKANFHAIEVWAKLLTDERHGSDCPIDPIVAGQLAFHVAVVGSHWNESIRYSPVQAEQEVVVDVFNSVEWLKNHHHLLWS